MARSTRSESSSSSSSSSSSISSRFTASSIESTWSATHRRIPMRQSLSVRVFAYAAGASPTSDVIRTLTKDTNHYSRRDHRFPEPQKQCFWVEDSYRGSSRSRAASLRNDVPGRPAPRSNPIPGNHPRPVPPPGMQPPGNPPPGLRVPGMPGAVPMMAPGVGAGRGRPAVNHAAPMPGRQAGPGVPPAGHHPAPGFVPPARAV